MKVNNQLQDTPKEKSIKELIDSINEFKADYPTIVEPEYINGFVVAFENYLDSLDLLNQETALEVIDLGKSFAKALAGSKENHEVGTIFLNSHVLLPEIIDTKSEFGRRIKILVTTKEPRRFTDNPNQEASYTNRAKATWALNVQLNAHLIASRYIKRESITFTKDVVMNRYHMDRENKIPRETAHNNVINWIKSYNKPLHKIPNEIGLQIHDLETFDKAYNRWKAKLYINVQN